MALEQLKQAEGYKEEGNRHYQEGSPKACSKCSNPSEWPVFSIFCRFSCVSTGDPDVFSMSRQLQEGPGCLPQGTRDESECRHALFLRIERRDRACLRGISIGTKGTRATRRKVFCYINGLNEPPVQKDSVPASNQIPREKLEVVKALKEATRLNMAATRLSNSLLENVMLYDVDHVISLCIIISCININD